MRRIIEVSLLALVPLVLAAMPAHADHERVRDIREIGYLAEQMKHVASHLQRVTRRGSGYRIDTREHSALDAVRNLKRHAARLSDLVEDRRRGGKHLSRRVGELSRALDRTLYAFDRLDRGRRYRHDLRRLDLLMTEIGDIYGAYRYAGYRFRGHRR